ncbi:uncharacterized protein LOC133834301 [Humulus lupulus]|uniref:uncharacterized protein LOC133834301 n=1 Tax=Humulus lupulus TaxID=3486 RepID=UPI002B40AACA|nr:uncharacterized protein LOC133834301 [Humulus lupulus]
MEEVRKIALAYYANLSDGQKEKVKSLFKEMAADGDEKVTLSEYENNFKKLGLSCNIPKNSSLFKEIFQERKTSFFMELDKNGDGSLDFEEFITLFYLLKTGRLLFCTGNGCQVFLGGIFFTCPQCFDNPRKTNFTLCLDCFSSKNYSHKHPLLVDNYAFLLSKVQPKSAIATTFEVLTFGADVISVASLCAIM